MPFGKSKDRRFQDALDTISTVGKRHSGNGNLAAIDAFVNGLTQQQRDKLSQSMSQGGTVMLKLGSPLSYGTTHKVARERRRALTLVLLAKTATIPTIDADILRVCTTVNNLMDNVLQHRLTNEVENIDQAVLKNAISALHPSWFNVGWDATKRRPLLAGSSIGRRGSLGPGTLGCFVTIGGPTEVYLLSNAHVLLQQGSTDNEILQPPHVLGGSYFDVVGDYVQQAAHLDAAVARVRPGLVCDNVTPAGTVITGDAVATAAMLVTKWGAATRQRLCTVQNAAAPNVATPTQTLQHQLILDRQPAEVTQYALQVPGDSGSVVLDAAGAVVALAHGQQGIDQVQATHIAPILAAFGAQIMVGQVTAT